MTTEILDHATKCSMNQNSTPGGYSYTKEAVHMDSEHQQNKPNKGHMKRQNSMKDDSGVKEQYSRTSIFRRIYQHCTTREQIAFTLNHHHTTTSDNSKLPENMPRSYIRVLFE